MYYRGYGCGPWGGWGPGPQRGFDRWGGHRFGQHQPPVDITESDTEYTIKMYAPALEKEKIQLSTKNDILTVTYRGDEKADDRNFTRREYRGNSIERSFDLKGKVDADNISAKYNDGVLTILLPKSANAKKPAQNVPIN
jgi:HSP20 family protein